MSILILDTNVLIALSNFFEKTRNKISSELARIYLSDILKGLKVENKCKFVWIPKTVEKEFLVYAKRGRKKRKKFLKILAKIFAEFDVGVDLCPIYDKNRINELSGKYSLDPGESDALNQAIKVLEMNFVLKNKHLGTSKVVILSNDRDITDLAGKLPEDVVIKKPPKDWFIF